MFLVKMGQSSARVTPRKDINETLDMLKWTKLQRSSESTGLEIHTTN
jgi:hypothetical protein